MERDNDATLTQGARPNQQHEPAARYNGAQCGATALHIPPSPTEHAERLSHYDGNPSLFETPEAAAHSPDSAYVAGGWNRMQMSGRCSFHLNITL